MVHRRGLSPSQLLSVQQARTSRLPINAPCRCSISDTDSAVLQVERRREGGCALVRFSIPASWFSTKQDGLAPWQACLLGRDPGPLHWQDWQRPLARR